MASLALWGASLCLAALGTTILLGRGVLHDALTIGLGNAIVFAAFGVFWLGFRDFEKRTGGAAFALAGAALWAAACGVPDFFKSFPLRVALSSLIMAAYALAAAWEVWRGRRERLVSRIPVAGVLVAHGLLVLHRAPIAFIIPDPRGTLVFSMPWITLHAFEQLLFVVVIAHLLLAMTKERGESDQRRMASSDPLTEVLNRRAFMEEGRRFLEADRRACREASLLLFDLDHFKHVNDRFGHAAGDEVLRALSRTAAESMPKGALLARLGGEEFGCLLPNTPLSEALVAAERLRCSFSASPLTIDGVSLSVTVSIGVATSADAGHVLDSLLATADLALYRAKHLGRDRVEGNGDAGLIEALAA